MAGLNLITLIFTTNANGMLNSFASNNRTLIHIKQKLTKLKGSYRRFQHLSPSNPQNKQNISKVIEDLINTINKIDIINIY